MHDLRGLAGGVCSPQWQWQGRVRREDWGLDCPCEGHCEESQWGGRETGHCSGGWREDRDRHRPPASSQSSVLVLWPRRDSQWQSFFTELKSANSPCLAAVPELFTSEGLHSPPSMGPPSSPLDDAVEVPVSLCKKTLFLQNILELKVVLYCYGSA